ncbi:MAG: hypothetical protein WBE63_06795, partial [Acidobacteriaceae bacterium]
MPTEEKLRSGTADASLTRSHSASSVQLGVAPGGVLVEQSMANILTAADDRVFSCEVAELWIERTGLL